MPIGISFGYIYTWVISDLVFLNIGITPGFGNQRIELETLSGERSVQNVPAAQLVAQSALGYESKYFYMGITGMVTWCNFITKFMIWTSQRNNLKSLLANNLTYSERPSQLTNTFS